MTTVVRRGVSAVGVIIALLALLLIGGAVAYFGSDVFRTKTDEQIRQLSEWTPENIARDPVNYLNFCETEAEKALEKLKASEIAVAQKKAKLEGMRDDATKEISAGEMALDELKTAFRDASDHDSWPITFLGQDRTEDWTKRQILRFHREVKSQTELRSKVERGIERLNAQSIKIQDQRDRCQEQLATIATNREILKVQQITDELTDQLVNMRGVLETAVAVVGDDPDSLISLDALTTETETGIDEDAFNAIMNE